MFFLLLRVSLGCPLLNFRLRFRYGLQPVLTPAKFFWDIHPVRNLFGIGFFAKMDKLFNFGPQLLLDFAGMFPAQGMVIARIVYDDDYFLAELTACLAKLFEIFTKRLCVKLAWFSC